MILTRCSVYGEYMNELKPFLVRLRPDVVELLEQASKSMSKTRSALINNALREYLADKGDLDQRLKKMLG